MPNTQLPPFIQHLMQPGAYPHPVAELRLVQTHISYVLLAGDFVYKFKKPVNFGFLDFTTLAQRRHFCEQELCLNRRLCPDIYLGLITINDRDGSMKMGGGETGDAGVVEYGIKMKRLPEERMMVNVIRDGALDAGMVAAISDVLVGFYEKADGGGKISSFGTAASVSVNVLENFEQTLPFVDGGAISGKRFRLIEKYARNFLAREELFARRIEEGRVKDCHGDLYSANICLADKVYIYDCIEFNQRFRYCDMASDVAFLAMDLDFNGLHDLSRLFIDRFSRAARDEGLSTMLNFYKCYRACVRGKIGLFMAHAPEVDPVTRESSLAQAQKYFQLAEDYATA